MKKILNIISELILEPLITSAFLLFVFWIAIKSIELGVEGWWFIIILIWLGIALSRAISTGHILAEKYPEIFKD